MEKERPTCMVAPTNGIVKKLEEAPEPPPIPPSAAEIFAQELGFFSEVRREGAIWRAQCPAVECRDRSRGTLSLVFTLVEDGVVLRCDEFCDDAAFRESLQCLLEPVSWETEPTFLARSKGKGVQTLPLPPPRPASTTSWAVDALDFARECISPPVARLSPWLTEESLSMIYARPGIGKTWLALGIAYAVATGGEILKWRAPAPREVLYVDGEMSKSDVHRRLNLLFLRGDPPRGGLRLLCNSRMKPGLPDLSTEEGQRLVEQELGGAGVLVLDNITTLFRSGTENEAESWAKAERWLLTLRDRRLAVLLLHHSGKSGTQRGTSRREVVLNNILRLSETRGEDEGCSFQVHFEKARDLTAKDKKPFKASLVSEANGGIRFAWQDLRGALREDILERRAQGFGVREIGRQLGVDVAYVSRVLKAGKPLDL